MSPWSARFPYNELPPLPPPADVETPAVLRACIGARARLAALKEATALIPGPDVLIQTIPLLEARGSSEIEHIVTTTDALFRFVAREDQAADPAVKEALRYRAALYEGFASLAQRPLTAATAARVCTRIKGTVMDVRRVPGTALGNADTGAVVYTPPEGEARLRDLLANWERFVNEPSELDPLVRMAVAHYQFEAIHPFTDGNGRTGRILNLLLLVQDGLLDLPVLYLSRAILRQKGEYLRRLLAVTAEGAWEPWILFMLSTVADTAGWTLAKIHAVVKLREAASDRVRAHPEGARIHSRELVDLVFERPYARIQDVVVRGIAKRQTAAEYLKTLVRIGLLREVSVGREKLFTHPALLRLLGSEAHDVMGYGPAPR